ncbi:hypothetical protein GF318_05640 [Candidatus Micrarchaeota archaeon]|nr:hypothetical protein [Candidatus Micrarchaeota archaeon]
MKWSVFLFLAVVLISGCIFEDSSVVRTKNVDISNPKLIEEATRVANEECPPNIVECKLDLSKLFVEVGAKRVHHMNSLEFRDLYFYRFECNRNYIYVTCEYMDRMGADSDYVLYCY